MSGPGGDNLDDYSIVKGWLEDQGKSLELMDEGGVNIHKAEGAVDDIGKVDDVLEGGEVLERGSATVNGFDTTINTGKQGKHIVGNNNFIEGRSIFNGTADDAQRLVDDFAGTGEWIGVNKERVNFGEVIGQYVNPATNEVVDTTVGIIHYSKTGTHIVPAQPAH